MAKVREFPFLSKETVKYVLLLLGLTGAVFAFFHTSQASQDRGRSENGNRITVVETKVEGQGERYQELRSEIGEQRVMIEGVREEVVKVHTTQIGIQKTQEGVEKKLDKIVEELKKLNGTR